MEAHLVVWQWEPRHEGMLAQGATMISVDQGGAGWPKFTALRGLSALVRDDWVIGVAGGEIPRLGTVKLMVGGGICGTRGVPSVAIALFAVLGDVFAPVVSEKAFRWLNRSPELVMMAKTNRDHDDEAS